MYSRNIKVNKLLFFIKKLSFSFIFAPHRKMSAEDNNCHHGLRRDPQGRPCGH